MTPERFKALCEALPADVYWTHPLTPGVAEAIWDAAVADTMAKVRPPLLLALYHHQGGSSPVGQPIRRLLGIGQFDDLTPEQLAEAKTCAPTQAPAVTEIVASTKHHGMHCMCSQCPRDPG